MFDRIKHNLVYKIAVWFIVTTFGVSLVLRPAYAQSVLNLPEPGAMVLMSPSFTPAMMKGMTIYPEDPFKFDFIIDRGDTTLEGEAFKAESTRLIKYFLASLTTSEEKMWVNLSPTEKDRIIAEGFDTTEMGRDLLAQDYILKQLTASLLYPENELGKLFWNKVYAEAQEKLGTNDIPMNTFNKVWIIPERAEVYVHGKSAFVVGSHLKVMLEEEYKSGQRSVISGQEKEQPQQPLTTDHLALTTLKEIIIPAIEKEVNEGRNFIQLRQIYNSLILATWYKKNLKKSLFGQVYVDKNKTKGVDVEDKQIKQKIYEQYLAAFKKGIYDYIKEDYDPVTQEVVLKKYFSGGVDAAMIGKVLNDSAQVNEGDLASLATTQPEVVTTEIRRIPSNLGDAAVLGSMKGIDLSNPKRRFGLELEYLGADIAGIARDGFGSLRYRYSQGENVPEIVRVIAGYERIKSQLPSMWFYENLIKNAKAVPSFVEVKIPAENGYEESPGNWQYIKDTLDVLQIDSLKGGVYSLHIHVSDNSVLKDEKGYLIVDKKRLGRVVKGFEAMWRALAGRGWSSPVTTTNLELLREKSDNERDIGGGIEEHRKIIRLSAKGTLEGKIFNGNQKSEFGAGKLLNVDQVQEEVGVMYALLDSVKIEKDDIPLASIGLPILAGHKPTEKQIDRFIKLFFRNHSRPADYAKKVLLQDLHNEEAGLGEFERRMDMRSMRRIFEEYGLGQVWQRHEEHDGYDEDLVDYFLMKEKGDVFVKDNERLLGLAQDLVKSGATDEIALGYFDQSMRPKLQEAITLMRSKNTNGEGKPLSDLAQLATSKAVTVEIKTMRSDAAMGAANMTKEQLLNLPVTDPRSPNFLSALEDYLKEGGSKTAEFEEWARKRNIRQNTGARSERYHPITSLLLDWTKVSEQQKREAQRIKAKIKEKSDALHLVRTDVEARKPIDAELEELRQQLVDVIEPGLPLQKGDQVLTPNRFGFNVYRVAGFDFGGRIGDGRGLLLKLEYDDGTPLDVYDLLDVQWAIEKNGYVLAPGVSYQERPDEAFRNMNIDREKVGDENFAKAEVVGNLKADVVRENKKLLSKISNGLDVNDFIQQHGQELNQLRQQEEALNEEMAAILGANIKRGDIIQSEKTYKQYLVERVEVNKDEKAGFTLYVDLISPDISDEEGHVYLLSPNATQEVLANARVVAEITSGADAAMVVTKNAEAPGGIDLNPNQMDLQTSGEEVPLYAPVDPAVLKTMSDIEGVYPMIINVTPILNLPLLLGIKEPSREENLSYAK